MEGTQYGRRKNKQNGITSDSKVSFHIMKQLSGILQYVSLSWINRRIEVIRATVILHAFGIILLYVPNTIIRHDLQMPICTYSSHYSHCLSAHATALTTATASVHTLQLSLQPPPQCTPYSSHYSHRLSAHPTALTTATASVHSLQLSLQPPPQCTP
jgi:hypothetical protein